MLAKLAKSENFHQTFSFHGFSGRKEKVSGDVSFPVTSLSRFLVQFHEFIEGRLQMAREKLN